MTNQNYDPVTPKWENSPAKECSKKYDELLANRPPNPRDIEFQRVVDRYNHQDDVVNPQRGTVRHAWREFKISCGLLGAALKQWCRLIPCRLWWHSMPVDGSPYYSIKVCRRCGAWRES
jgi:hypothetical protein